MFGSGRSFTYEHRSFEQLQRDVLARCRFDLQFVLPRAEPIDPGDDRVFVPADVAHVETAGPFVIARSHEVHRRFAPRSTTIERRGCRVVYRRGVPIPQNRSDHGMPVSENVGADLDRLADRPFNRKPPAVNVRLDALDDDAVEGS